MRPSITCMPPEGGKRPAAPAPVEGADSPEKAWAVARSSLPHVARKISDARWMAYWDAIAEDCGRFSGAGSQLEGDIFRSLHEDGTFLPGDTVLDVGCGPGTYALRFARDARRVVGLDLSAGMLRKLREVARSEGVDNIDVVRSAWEDYAPDRRYDLVFSSFCPALNEPAALLKMERHSRRHCCYVSLAGAGRETQPLYRLWSELTGERFSNDGYDVAYPLSYLIAMGREPGIRHFTMVSDTSMPAEKAVDKYTAYFRMFTDLDAAGKELIRDFVRRHSRDGMFGHTERRTVGVITWETGRAGSKRG